MKLQSLRQNKAISKFFDVSLGFKIAMYKSSRIKKLGFIEFPSQTGAASL
jgi:hypothetical protein